MSLTLLYQPNASARDKIRALEKHRDDLAKQGRLHGHARTQIALAIANLKKEGAR